jgi:H+/Cl- antiporter ClcA
MNIDRISRFITEPYHLLGFLFLIVGGISMCTGKTLTRGQGLVSRAKEPKTFWLIVAVWFLAGTVFIGFLFKNN